MKRKTLAYLVDTGTKVISDGLRVYLSKPKPRPEEEEVRVTPSVAVVATPTIVTPEVPLSPPGLQADSLSYQLELLADDLDALATEHLPNQGKIQGKICDCLAKHGRELRRHARETIPIASREGKDATIFSEMVATGDRLIEIGTPAAVKTGLYNAEYLKLAGVVSNYYKQVDKMLRERGKQGECDEPECQEMKELWKKVGQS